MVRPSRNRCSCCEICLIALLLFVLLSDPHPLRSHSPASVRSSQLDQGALQAIIPAEFTPFGTARFVFVLRSLWLPTNSVFLTFDLFIDCVDCRPLHRCWANLGGSEVRERAHLHQRLSSVDFRLPVHEHQQQQDVHAQPRTNLRRCSVLVLIVEDLGASALVLTLVFLRFPWKNSRSQRTCLAVVCIVAGYRRDLRELPPAFVLLQLVAVLRRRPKHQRVATQAAREQRSSDNFHTLLRHALLFVTQRHK